MDLRQFYRKIREVEAAIEELYPIVVSLATPDGGIAGVLSEISRIAAARQIVEGKVRLANDDEQLAFLEQCDETRKMAERAAFARRMQVTLLTEDEAEQEADEEALDSEGE